jgi:hypothetical protein
MTRKGLTRRDFLRAAAVAPFVNAVGCCCTGNKLVPVPDNNGAHLTQVSRLSKVVLVRDERAVGEGRAHNTEVVQKMLDEAVMALFGEKDPGTAWKLLVKPSDTVGIKTNTWNFLPTGSAIEGAIKRRVLEAGVPENRISVRDRGVLADLLFEQASVLINARPARVHYWSGMGSCIKNYIQFVPKPSEYHGDACADLATIWSLPIVKGKTKLNVLSLLTPQYHNIGPRGFNEAYLWPYRGLVIGQDPVAVDATGFRIIQAKRREVFGEDRPLETSAHHIALADTRYKLGHSDPSDIDLIKLGWTDAILI